MDVPPRSAEFEESNELERLRRRAYGPDADIAGDAAAQARLSELEAAQRRQQTRVVDATGRVTAPVPVGAPVLGPVDGSHSASRSVSLPNRRAVSEHDPDGGSVAEEHPGEGPIADFAPIAGAPVTSWWRRRRWLAILCSAIVVLALNAALVARMSQLLAQESTTIPPATSTVEIPPGPDVQRGPVGSPALDFVLALRSVGSEGDRLKDPHDTLNPLGLSSDELRRYENFRGLGVWSGESRDGMACLLVADPRQGLREGIGDAKCSPAGIDAIIDVSACSGCASPELFAGLPTGSLFRFVLKGDYVDVYLGEADAIDSQG